METNRKARTVARRSFTTLANQVTALLDEEEPRADDVGVMLELLRERLDQLMTLEQNIYEDLLNNDEITEDDLLKEQTEADKYSLVFKTISRRYDKLSRHNDTVGNDDASSTISNIASMVQAAAIKRVRLPTIAFTPYDGDLKGWLQFWSHFRKIHEDKELDKDDKFYYLMQALTPGSPAAKTVSSFPPVGKNYDGAIERLKDRFGRDDLLVEVYVRELLKLILNKVLQGKNETNLCQLYDNLDTQLRALDSLGVQTDTCAAMLYPLVESCLPEDLLRAWQRSMSFDRKEAGLKARLEQLMRFLGDEVQNEQRIGLAVEGFGVMSDVKSKKSISRMQSIPTAAALFSGTAQCVFCDREHNSEACIKAQHMSFDDKKKILTSKGACFNCLKPGHVSRKCKQKLRCLICSGKHVSLMCSQLGNKGKATEKVTSENPADVTSPRVENALANLSNTCVFLQTMIVCIRNDEFERRARVVIDTGSQRSYILNTTAREMNYVSQRQEKVIHSLFGGTHTKEGLHDCYNVRLGSLDGKYNCKFEAMGQPVICNDVRSIFNGPWLEELRAKEVFLTDVDRDLPIEVLIGADIAGKLFTGNKIDLKSGPVAVQTHLGWTMMGKVTASGSENRSSAMTAVSLLVNDSSIAKLWHLDVLGIEAPQDHLSKQDVLNEINHYFLETIRFDENGRYVVSMPWKVGHPILSNNWFVAKKRLENLMKKLKSQKMHKEYDDIFKEWERDGVIEQVDAAVAEQCHYLPHRAVIKPNSQTCKIRPVFDASSHEKGSPSLNDCLEEGPNLIELIPAILLRFRLFRVGVTADIRRAFLQISVSNEERDFLRFIWIDTNGVEKTYRHKRVVFGVCCSPYLLGMTIKYHLNQQLKFVERTNIVKILLVSFYVDNCVASLENASELECFRTRAIAIMEEGCFELRSWANTTLNNTDVAQEVPLLGLTWNTGSDTLRISLDESLLEAVPSVTKRTMLSYAQKIFDPVGYTCPSTLLPKLWLQETWKSNLSWDDELPVDLRRKFLHWVSELTYLKRIELPRWIGFTRDTHLDVSLHTFCDASKDAYAAVVYLRLVSPKGIHVHMLQAKARVSPLKAMTIPRLELLAATIGVRLCNSVIQSLGSLVDVTKLKRYFWSDSSTVLSWIRQQDQWSVFVWNRVKEIRELSGGASWLHVPGKINPADLPSRGCSPKRLFESQWWEGPNWLRDESNWPKGEDDFVDVMEVNSEKRKRAITALMLNEEPRWYDRKFSSYSSVVRVMGWILRFISNCRSKTQLKDKLLTFNEFQKGETVLIKLVQQECFSEPKKRELSSLCLFNDDKGIIRLRSKVSNREDLSDFIYPILLPSKHSTIEKLIREKHEECHTGVLTLTSQLRERFWILGGRRAVRKVVTKCVKCRIHSAKTLKEITPPLPMDRVRDACVFEVVGLDLAGPLYLKGAQKVYICIFTCAIYRAVHFELLTSMSTECFIEALRRFIARRGRPRTIYSDNGTNFVGAENSMCALNWDLINRYCFVNKIDWKFNPPTAAWWGGFWERLIGVLKSLLKRVLGKASLTYEELYTVICDCEAVVNSRPLTYLSDNANEMRPLSPNAFLQEQREIGVPDLDVMDANSLNRRVVYRNKLKENLRKRFRLEYLGSLRLANSTASKETLKVGDVVLVSKDNVKRIEWPMARVLELIPGRDGRVRVVRLKTAFGQLFRPVQRLCLLEASSPEDILLEKREGMVSAVAEEEDSDPTNDEDDVGSGDSTPHDEPKFDRRGRQIKKPARFC